MVVYIFGEKYCIGYYFLYIINLRLADVAEDAFLLEVVNKAIAAGIALMDVGMDEVVRCEDVCVRQYSKTLLSDLAVQVIDIVA